MCFDLQVLLEKFKEKNPAVGKSANESLTVMHKYCFSLMDVAETLTGLCCLCVCICVRVCL